MRYLLLKNNRKYYGGGLSSFVDVTFMRPIAKSGNRIVRSTRYSFSVNAEADKVNTNNERKYVKCFPTVYTYKDRYIRSFLYCQFHSNIIFP